MYLFFLEKSRFYHEPDIKAKFANWMEGNMKKKLEEQQTFPFDFLSPLVL